jgi:hypothetical protein
MLLGETKFFSFITFERDTINYKGTLVENAKKKLKINPPYCRGAYSTGM